MIKRARKYNKKIELWQTTDVFDGYSGYATTSTLIDNVWCEISTNNSTYRDTDFGKTETTNKIVVKLRKRNDIDYVSKNLFFKYRGNIYTIVSEPININFEDREIQIVLQLQPNG